jgi:hypothetical protein
MFNSLWESEVDSNKTSPRINGHFLLISSVYRIAVV